MPEVITVKEIIHPAVGKKQGSVVDTSNRRWQVWGDKLANYQVGGSYEVLTTSSRPFQGKTYVTIDTMVPVSAAQPQAVHASVGSWAAPPPPTTAQMEQATKMPIPAPSMDDNARRMDIFVCGCINNTLGNQNVNPLALTDQDIHGLVERYKKAWRQTMGPRQEPSGDMSDSISF